MKSGGGLQVDQHREVGMVARLLGANPRVVMRRRNFLEHTRAVEGDAVGLGETFYGLGTGAGRMRGGARRDRS